MQMAFAFAGTENETEGKSKDTESQQQQTEAAKPNDDLAESFVGGIAGEEENQADSTIVDDSVSKYNFILYFLYKFKYEEEEGL